MKKDRDKYIHDSLGVYRYERWLYGHTDDCPKCGGIPEEIQEFGSEMLQLYCEDCGYKWEVKQKAKVTWVRDFDHSVLFGPDGRSVTMFLQKEKK